MQTTCLDHSNTEAMQKTYENEDIKVIWNPSMCIHSTKCWKEMGKVFAPMKRPWVNLDGDTAENIRKQIDKCPSGALAYVWKGEATAEAAPGASIQMLENGPMLVSGKCVITHSNGETEEREGNTALCRCGASANKPYCDGSHNQSGFQG